MASVRALLSASPPTVVRAVPVAASLVALSDRAVILFADDVAINDVGQNQKGIDEVVASIRALGRRSVGVVADVSSSDQCDSMVAAVVAALGRLDTMVANAGIADVQPLLETTEADRERMLSVNCHGLMNSCKSPGSKQNVFGEAKLIS